MDPSRKDPLGRLAQQAAPPGEFDPDAVRATSIRLDQDGECPQCRRPLLGLGAGACAFCETPFGAWLEELPAAVSRLQAMAPGWTPERLRRWVLPRPAQLAWAYETRAWANLGTWMDEDLRGGLARLEMSRRGRGLGTRFEHVEVTAVRLQARGDTSDWAALRVEGRRRAAPYGEEDDDGQELAPFLEWWSLRPTGRPDRDADSVCRSCGGGIAFQEERCRHCGAAPVREPGPWLVEGIVVQGGDGASRRLHMQGLPAFMPRV
jgi:hypothetical protein